MNNKLNIKITLCVGILFFLSCSDLLEENPTTFYSEKSVYSTESGVETAVNGMYYQMASFEYYGSGFLNLVLPASGLFYSSQTANLDAVGLNINPSNINLVQMWAGMYKTINASNLIIANLQNTGDELKNKNTALGNAYFIRAHTYLNLLRFFGGVPLRLAPADGNNLHLKRASKDEVAKQIIDDLTKAKNLMPEKDKTIYNRPAKWAANVYLAKLYMYLAQNDASMWQKAKDELIPVINSKAYKLLPTYAEIFREGNENTAESIFELQYGHTGNLRTSDIIRLFTPSNSIYAPASAPTFGRIRPNKEVYDNHRSAYPDDPRIDATHLFDQYTLNTSKTQSIWPKQKTGNNAFTVIAKWFDKSYNGNTTERNYILLRYADVLLMMAEIENEISGPDAAYQYVNLVLKRARDKNGDGVSDATHPKDYAALTKDVFRNRIMFERRYELLSEGEDWADTRRRGLPFLLSTVIIPHNTNKNLEKNKEFIYPETDKNLLMPIPSSEIGGNQLVTVKDQNPGY
jgi:hypothetical protein